MINSKDISVVIQGTIEQNITIKSLKSIRKYLPDAEIILSTWKNSTVEGLDYDKIIFNKDPGALYFHKYSDKYNNVNRIIISSQNGVNAATRKYILRMRSDMIMKNDNILKLCDTYPYRNPKDTLFKNRLFAYELFSIKFEERFDKKYYSIFHISDWCLFGLTEDMKEYYNIYTVKEAEFSHYFAIYTEKQNPSIDIWPERLWKMSPEQYINKENARKIYKNLEFEHRLDYNDENIELCNKFIVNNFVIKSVNEWGIYNKKSSYDNKVIKDFPVCRNGAWLGLNFEEDYKKYCDPTYQIPIKYTWYNDFHLSKYLAKLKKHWGRFITPFKIMAYLVSDFLSVIYYILHIILNLIIFLPKFIYKFVKSSLQKEETL